MFRISCHNHLGSKWIIISWKYTILSLYPYHKNNFFLTRPESTSISKSGSTNRNIISITPQYMLPHISFVSYTFSLFFVFFARTAHQVPPIPTCIFTKTIVMKTFYTHKKNFCCVFFFRTLQWQQAFFLRSDIVFLFHFIQSTGWYAYWFVANVPILFVLEAYFKQLLLEIQTSTTSLLIWLVVRLSDVHRKKF
jgi:hypothetical protein